MIKTMHGVYDLKRALKYAIPRLFLAFIIGLVVSTPLSLQIFRGEVAVQLQRDQTNQIEQAKEKNAALQTGQDLKDAEQSNLIEQRIRVAEAAGGFARYPIQRFVVRRYARFSLDRKRHV